MVGYGRAIVLCECSMVSTVYPMLDFNLFTDTEEHLIIVFLVLCLG
jgi:hypothetical protein